MMGKWIVRLTSKCVQVPMSLDCIFFWVRLVKGQRRGIDKLKRIIHRVKLGKNVRSLDRYLVPYR